ncbi:MAG: endonuclease NucS [Acidobacteriia bacterium]|nr:endonuclease NucS [Terriglobia bacterium]
MATTATQEPEFESLPLRLAWGFLEANGLATEAAEIRKSPERLGSYTTSLKRAKIVGLLRRKGLLDKFMETNWRFALTPDGKKKLSWYDQIYSRYEKAGAAPVPSTNAGIEDQTEAGTEFALEEQLRDYLAENLGILEPGLSLWPVENGDAVEFQVDDQGPSRRIDILARDSAGLPVVIELKVSRGHEKTVGQALYYRARIKHRFGSARVRIFIVAAEISPELQAAASEVSDVFLFEYSLAVKVTAIT